MILGRLTRNKDIVLMFHVYYMTKKQRNRPKVENGGNHSSMKISKSTGPLGHLTEKYFIHKQNVSIPRALFRYINDSNMQTFRVNFIRNNEVQNHRTQEPLQKHDLIRFSNTKENLSKINLSSFSF